MAYDKVVDSAQLNAGLTTIANAIREKAGVSDNFTFPSGFAAAIAAIEAGGGGGGLIGNYGEVIPASATDEITIEHGLGVIPKAAVIFPDATYSRTNNQVLLAYRYNNDGGCFCRLSSSSSYGGNGTAGSITNDSFSNWGYGAFAATESTIKFGSGASTYKFKSGAPHYWLVIG